MVRMIFRLWVIFAVLPGIVVADGTTDEAADGAVSIADIPYGVIDQSLVPFAYTAGERFRYDVSYTGGFKLGELYLWIENDPENADSLVINARVTTDNGMFSAIYPIEDVYATRVSGKERLPFHYEVWQKEGYSYEAHRITLYDQPDKTVYYYVNDNPVEIFEISDTTQNEFSSFFASRVMNFVVEQPFIVPTFADEKRIEVVVMVRGKKNLKKTILGDVNTVIVEPIMTFSGLYDKRGDTVIWYTDDECRVPVKVNSKLLLGSLTAKLVAYQNPACPGYDGAMLDKYKEEKPKKNNSTAN